MAPVFEPTSVGSDHNMLVMSTMRRLAPRHGLAFLIHEKPFAGINGSGKHNNWSMSTDEDENLLDPGTDPHANAQFLVFLLAVIRAVNEHADILRASIADAGQDHRLGANEAPPAIMSVFLGSQLEDVIHQLEDGAASASKKGGNVELGVTSLPVLPKDATDRNRTSPFAFTGNKFEFRAVGSSAPIYWPQTVLNTAVADSLKQLADEIEKLKPGDFDGLTKVLSPIAKSNKQVLFEGNGYSEEWHAEAKRRGLPNNPTTVDALPALTTAKAKKLFKSFGVLSERELASRVDIAWERYVKVSNIEASCALDMARTMVLPAAARYLGELASAGASGASRGVAGACDKVGELIDTLSDRIEAWSTLSTRPHEAGTVEQEARAFVEHVIPAPGRAARGRRRARDGRRGRPLAAAEVPGAALPVLSSGTARGGSDFGPASFDSGRRQTPSGRKQGDAATGRTRSRSRNQEASRATRSRMSGCSHGPTPAEAFAAACSGVRVAGIATLTRRSDSVQRSRASVQDVSPARRSSSGNGRPSSEPSPNGRIAMTPMPSSSASGRIRSSAARSRGLTGTWTTWMRSVRITVSSSSNAVEL
jgi:hypothetical protein